MNIEDKNRIIELINQLQELGASIDYDNEGQLIIYSNLITNDDGELVEMK